MSNFTYTDGVVSMPSHERVERTLDGTLPADIPAVPLGAIDRVSRTAIRKSFATLAADNVENAHRWLQEVAATNPRAALELFMELAQFSIPKVKAIAVDVRTKDGSLARLSMSELQSIVSEQ